MPRHPSFLLNINTLFLYLFLFLSLSLSLSDWWRGCVHPCKHKARPHSKHSSFSLLVSMRDYYINFWISLESLHFKGKCKKVKEKQIEMLEKVRNSLKKSYQGQTSFLISLWLKKKVLKHWNLDLPAVGILFRLKCRFEKSCRNWVDFNSNHWNRIDQVWQTLQ